MSVWFFMSSSFVTIEPTPFAVSVRSIFKADRLMFALHLVHCLYPQSFGKGEWEFFTGQSGEVAVVDPKEVGFVLNV